MTVTFSPTFATAVTIDSVRVRQSPERTRLVFDLSAPVEHSVFTLSGPERLVIDVENTELKASLRALRLDETPILKIRSARKRGGNLRVVLDLSTSVKPRSFVLKPIMQYGDRLVIDLYTKVQQVKPTVREADQLSQQMRDVVIALDAGHGGDDPGAIGFRKVYEKDVVLAIARELEKLIQQAHGYKPVMVRTNDYYVALTKRTAMARESKADLFVSIHADAFLTVEARGASVYAISDKGASSEQARWLAENENRADLIGGVDNVSLSDKDDLLAGVLLDLSMTASLTASLDVGALVLNAMGEVTRLHTRKVEQAAFAVLKSPDVPSILVETGYISNPTDAEALSSKRHQRKLATAIFKGVQQYMMVNPPPGSYLAWLKQGRKGLVRYTIVRGDTLSEIAQRYQISAESLKKINQLANDRIKVGQVLEIPAT